MLVRFRTRLAPRRLALGLIIVERFLQAVQNFGGGLEHRFAARLIDGFDVAAQMIDKLLQPTRDFFDVVARIALIASLCLLRDAARGWNA